MRLFAALARQTLVAVRRYSSHEAAICPGTLTNAQSLLCSLPYLSPSRLSQEKPMLVEMQGKLGQPILRNGGGRTELFRIYRNLNPEAQT